jgi:SpoVK/Ycf46/Vps4 family AAA+-type ATPase
MKNQQEELKNVLSTPLKFPNNEAERRFSALVGLNEICRQLLSQLQLVFNPSLAKNWWQKHYKHNQTPLLDILEDCVPLFIFEGDVGTGKSVLAETIGDAYAREHQCTVQMVKMSTQVRGTGYVGQMGTLLANAFEKVEDVWLRKSDPVIFIIDEADSILTARTAVDHHHEDKSGVNTILQHLDSLRYKKSQIAVIAITNRFDVLDPAIRRRATCVITFKRPSKEQRRAFFSQIFTGMSFTNDDIEKLVNASEPRDCNGSKLPFSYSDLTLRFAIPFVRIAITNNQPLSVDLLVDGLQKLHPSPSI